MEKYCQMLFSSNSSCNNMAALSSANHPMIPAVGSSQVLYKNFDGGRDQSSDGFLGLRSASTENHVGGTGGSHENSASSDILHRQHDHQAAIEYNSAGKKNKAGGAEKKTRKPKYAFQTRSQVDILDDGYRWRKYGQKAVKNNKFPRSYYRCTYGGCNVKKQIQRLSKDEGIVVTTYEGMHTHPIDKPSDNFEHILNQMQIYTPF